MSALRESVLARMNEPTRAERELAERLRWSGHREPLAPIPGIMYSHYVFDFEYHLVRVNNESIGFETTVDTGTLYVTKLKKFGTAPRQNRNLCTQEPYTQFTLNCYDIIMEINGYKSILEMTYEMEYAQRLVLKVRRPPGTPTQIERRFVMDHGGWMIVTRAFDAETLSCDEYLEDYLTAIRGDVVYVWADSSRPPFSDEEPQDWWIWAVCHDIRNRRWYPGHDGWLPVSHLRVPAVTMGWT